MRQTDVENRMIVLINTSKRFGWDIPTPDLNAILAMGFWGVSEKSLLIRYDESEIPPSRHMHMF